MKKLRGVIIIVVCACLCVGYYFYLSQRDTAGNRAPTEFEQLTGKDLNKSYPNTPREVIRFYNRILKYLYSQEPTEDEVKVLGQQARILFDEELLEQNPENVYLAGLGNELAQYAKEKKKITSMTVSTSQEVEYKEIDGEDYAYVESSYYIQGEEDSERAGQMYILRKDEKGRWRILGFYRP